MRFERTVMSWYRRVAYLVIIYLVIVILLEITFRFLPVQESMGWLPLNETNPVRRFEPNRSFTWSQNWNFCLVNRLKSNNYGFISTIDYDPASTIPLTAVIGDSFIEAAMVDQTRTAVAMLNAKFQNSGRFYAFGTSGSQLSTYLTYAMYAKNEFNPDRYVFLMGVHYFDRRWTSNSGGPGAYYCVEDTAGGLAS